jgi:peptidoglycan/xylan/chitin deacetylase (PgdA/CDA1 family)
LREPRPEVIRLPTSSADLAPSQQFALRLLVDLARLPQVDDLAADAVVLEVTDEVRDTGVRGLAAWEPAVAPEGGIVRVPHAVLAGVTEVAGAITEQHSVLRDRHDRVPSMCNPLVAAGLEREPVVSQVAQRLQRAVLAAAGRRPVRFLVPWPNGKRWAAAFTHDLDVVSWWPAFTALRLAELASRGEARRLWQVSWAALGSAARNPISSGVDGLLDVERRHGVRSTWFVLCGTPSFTSARAGDLTYLPESRRARTILAAVAAAHHEIGLHGSFETLHHAPAFAAQRERLRRLVGNAATGVRQHYLRVRPGVTQESMRDAGFSYDASYGFPDRNGFRLGVADVVPAWHGAAHREGAFQEIPLVWMDRALSKYRRVEDPQAWVDDGLALAEACRVVQGLWVGLWHPNLVAALGFPGGPEAYRCLLRGVLDQDPFVETLEQISAWRRARRSVRIRGVGADGGVEAYATEPALAPLALEDESGRVRENVEPVA